MFLPDSARTDGLKGERDLSETAFEGVPRREWKPRKMGEIRVAGPDFPHNEHKGRSWQAGMRSSGGGTRQTGLRSWACP